MTTKDIFNYILYPCWLFSMLAVAVTWDIITGGISKLNPFNEN